MKTNKHYFKMQTLSNQLKAQYRTEQLKQLIQLLQDTPTTNCPNCQFRFSKRCPDTPTTDCYLPNVKADTIPNLILQAVASEFGITVSELKNKNRKRPLPDARKMASYFMDKYKTRQDTLDGLASILNIRHDGLLYNVKQHIILESLIANINKKQKELKHLWMLLFNINYNSILLFIAFL